MSKESICTTINLEEAQVDIYRLTATSAKMHSSEPYGSTRRLHPEAIPTIRINHVTNGLND